MVGAPTFIRSSKFRALAARCGRMRIFRTDHRRVPGRMNLGTGTVNRYPLSGWVNSLRFTDSPANVCWIFLIEAALRFAKPLHCLNDSNSDRRC